MEPRIGMKSENLKAEVYILTKILADEFLLFTKTLNAHWNVEGPGFHEKHLFFESQYKQLNIITDEIAERIRMLGHYAPASLKQFLELTQFTEKFNEKNDGNGFIKWLLEDQEQLIIEIRKNVKIFSEDFGDLGTSDFVTGILEQHEKMAWMLRAHIS